VSNVLSVGVCCLMRREDWERLGRLKPEERVNLAIGMSDVCIRVCAEGVRAQFPNISNKELMEKLRERFAWSKRYQKRKRYRDLFQHVR
jgi:hypothetical protein